MRILLAHNRYAQRGGEDMVFDAEAGLLRRFGHEVIEFVKDNKDIEANGRFALLRDTIWSAASCAELAALIRAERPALVHFHNTLPLISPAAIAAAKAEGVATVQTLHNYRLMCPSAVLFRAGRVCEACVGKRVAWPGVLHGCYRGSRPATAAVAAMLAVHRQLGTWAEKVDRHIALSEFARRKFVAAGLPAERVVVKPNFLAHDPGAGDGGGGFALFVGRLSPEKGIATLLAAWRHIEDRLPLKIVGGGPLAGTVGAAASEIRGIAWLGERPRDEVLDLIGRASVLVVPSDWHEPFGLVVIEAFAKGTPVIGADIGAIGSLIEDGENGLLYRAGDPADLAAKVAAFLERPGAAARMRQAARRRFEGSFTAERNHRQLIDIYEAAIDSSRRRPAD